MSSLSTASPQRLQALKIWPRKELKEVVHRLNYFEKTGLDHRKGRPEERPPFQGLEKSRYRALRYIGTETTLFTKRHGDRFTNHFSFGPDFYFFGGYGFDSFPPEGFFAHRRAGDYFLRWMMAPRKIRAMPGSIQAGWRSMNPIQKNGTVSEIAIHIE